jgi:hypothetical protein
VCAELKGKLSLSTSEPQDRLEDTLTDAVFTALKYLPRNILQEWLSQALPPDFAPLIKDAERAHFEFWPYLDGVEPDLTIEIGSLLVVVEAKYRSGFHTKNGMHQLESEWLRAADLATRRYLRGPIVVAVTSHFITMEDETAVRTKLKGRKELAARGLNANDAVRWSSWQQIAKSLQDHRQEVGGGLRELIDDVLLLLDRREVRNVFEGIDQADAWLLAGTAQVASERVYPKIAIFARELRDIGKPKGLIWGAADSGVVWNETKQLGNSPQWHRDFIELPYWNTRLPRKRGNAASLYVLFGLNRAAVDFGFWASVSNPAKWEPHIPGITASLAAMSLAGFAVAQGVSRRKAAIGTLNESITEAEVKAWLSKRGNWLRVDRSVAIGDLKSPDPAMSAFEEIIAELLKSDQALLSALLADGGLSQKTSSDVDSPEEHQEPQDLPGDV